MKNLIVNKSTFEHQTVTFNLLNHMLQYLPKFKQKSITDYLLKSELSNISNRKNSFIVYLSLR